MLKLKLDADGHVVVQDGKPVYTDDDGKDLAFDAEQMRTKISELNQESKTHRLSAREKQEILEKFGDTKPEDVAAIRKILDEVGGLDGITELKKKSGIDVEAIKKSMTESYEGKLKEAQSQIDNLTARERQLVVGNGIATSQFLGKTTFKDTRDVAEAYFGNRFKVENGKAVAYDGDEPVFSRSNPGQIASVDEALEYFINKHPQRDSFLLSTGGGSGAQGGGSGGNFGGVKSLKDFKTQADKSAYISEHGLEAFKALPAQ